MCQINITHTVYSSHLSEEEFDDAKSGSNYSEAVGAAYREWIEENLSGHDVELSIDVMDGVSGVGSGINVDVESEMGTATWSLERDITEALDAIAERIFNEGEWLVV